MSDMSDMEDGEMYDMPQGSSGRGMGDDPKKHARAQHNALERRRRDNIKDMYISLKDTVPGMENERASRAVILRKAIETITTKTNDYHEKKSKIKELEKEREELEKEVNKYRALKAQMVRRRPSQTGETEMVQAAIARGNTGGSNMGNMVIPNTMEL